MVLASLGLDPPPGLPLHAQAAPPPRPTPAEVRSYRGYLTGCVDTRDRVVWTPALPGATPEVRSEWLACLADKGATHVPIGPFTPGVVYPGVPWANPDWTRDPAALRALLLDILNTPTRRGHGMVPVIFLVSGDPAGQVERELPTVAATVSSAIEGLGPFVITLPCGWEPQAWPVEECRAALERWRPMSRGSVLAWHGWPDASHGGADGPRFWRELPFDMFLYQTRAIRTVAQAECRGQSSCPWKERLERALDLVGTSRPFVIFETVTFFDFRRMLEPGTREAVADAADAVCAKRGVVCGFGDGLPARLRE